MATTLTTYQHILRGTQRSVHCMLEAPHPIRPGDVVKDTVRLDEQDLIAAAEARGRDTWDQFDVATVLTTTLGVTVTIAPPEAEAPAAPAPAAAPTDFSAQLAAEFPNAVAAADLAVDSPPLEPTPAE